VDTGVPKQQGSIAPAALGQQGTPSKLGQSPLALHALGPKSVGGTVTGAGVATSSSAPWASHPLMSILLCG